jgi:hypothetical protein
LSAKNTSFRPKKSYLLATFEPQKSYIGQGWSRTLPPKSAFSDLFSQNFAHHRRLLAVGVSELVPTPELVRSGLIAVSGANRTQIPLKSSIWGLKNPICGQGFATFGPKNPILGQGNPIFLP